MPEKSCSPTAVAHPLDQPRRRRARCRLRQPAEAPGGQHDDRDHARGEARSTPGVTVITASSAAAQRHEAADRVADVGAARAVLRDNRGDVGPHLGAPRDDEHRDDGGGHPGRGGNPRRDPPATGTPGSQWDRRRGAFVEVGIRGERAVVAGGARPRRRPSARSRRARSRSGSARTAARAVRRLGELLAPNRRLARGAPRPNARSSSSSSSSR